MRHTDRRKKINQSTEQQNRGLARRLSNAKPKDGPLTFRDGTLDQEFSHGITWRGIFESLEKKKAVEVLPDGKVKKLKARIGRGGKRRGFGGDPQNREAGSDPFDYKMLTRLCFDAALDALDLRTRAGRGGFLKQRFLVDLQEYHSGDPPLVEREVDHIIEGFLDLASREPVLSKGLGHYNGPGYHPHAGEIRYFADCREMIGRLFVGHSHYDTIAHFSHDWSRLLCRAYESIERRLSSAGQEPIPEESDRRRVLSPLNPVVVDQIFADDVVLLLGGETAAEFEGEALGRRVRIVITDEGETVKVSLKEYNRSSGLRFVTEEYTINKETAEISSDITGRRHPTQKVVGIEELIGVSQRDPRVLEGESRASLDLDDPQLRAGRDLAARAERLLDGRHTAIFEANPNSRVVTVRITDQDDAIFVSARYGHAFEVYTITKATGETFEEAVGLEDYNLEPFSLHEYISASEQGRDIYRASPAGPLELNDPRLTRCRTFASEAVELLAGEQSRVFIGIPEGHAEEIAVRITNLGDRIRINLGRYYGRVYSRMSEGEREALESIEWHRLGGGVPDSTDTDSLQDINASLDFRSPEIYTIRTETGESLSEIDPETQAVGIRALLSACRKARESYVPLNQYQ